MAGQLGRQPRHGGGGGLAGGEQGGGGAARAGGVGQSDRQRGRALAKLGEGGFVRWEWLVGGGVAVGLGGGRGGRGRVWPRKKMNSERGGRVRQRRYEHTRAGEEGRTLSQPSTA